MCQPLGRYLPHGAAFRTRKQQGYEPHREDDYEREQEHRNHLWHLLLVNVLCFAAPAAPRRESFQNSKKRLTCRRFFERN